VISVQLILDNFSLDTPTARPDLSERACLLTVPSPARVKSLCVEHITPSTMRLMALGLYSEPLSLSSPASASSRAILRKLRRFPVLGLARRLSP